MDGKVLWSKQLGKMHTRHGHGEGASPALSGDSLVVNWDHEENSFVVVFDTRTGKEKWRVPRDEVTSWATPIVVQHEGRKLVVISGTRRITAYDLEDGRIIWECGGMSRNIVSSPVATEDLVIAGSSYETQSILAIRLDGARGDVSNSKQVVWRRYQRTPYVPSPLFYRGALYYLRHYQSILTKLDAKTGEEPLGPFRLDGIRNIYASPVAADGRVYITDRFGATIVLRHSETPEVLATNILNDRFNAGAALVGNQLILRGERFLYCIAEAE